MFDCLFEKTKELDLPSVEDEELFFWPAQVRSAVVSIWVFNLAPHFTLSLQGALFLLCVSFVSSFSSSSHCWTWLSFTPTMH